MRPPTRFSIVRTTIGLATGLASLVVYAQSQPQLIVLASVKTASARLKAPARRLVSQPALRPWRALPHLRHFRLSAISARLIYEQEQV